MGRPFARWAVRRALLIVCVLWGAATLAFLSIQALPGDPARAIAGGVQANASPQVLDRIRTAYGFNRSLPAQYGIYLWRVARGRLGTSYQLGEPVTTVLRGEIGATIELALGAAALGLALALAVALTTAGRPRPRAFAHVVELTCVSTPTFWIGILLLTGLSFELHLFPVIGGAGIRGLVLPWLTLALPIGAALARVARDGIERALEQPFATTVRARGASETRLRLRHALRHALLPVLTLSGWMLGELLGGVVVVETVFARQGLGQVMVTAVGARDFPVIAGLVMTTALAFVVINTSLEAVYRVADPRL